MCPFIGCVLCTSKPLHTSFGESDARASMSRHKPGSSNIPFLAHRPMEVDAGPRFAFGHLQHEDDLEEDVCVADLVLTEYQATPGSHLRVANAGGGGQPSVAGGAAADRR
jgi:hypothetical protein